MACSNKGTKDNFVLPAPLAQKLKEAVHKGAAKPQNALTRETLTRAIKRLREEEIERACRSRRRSVGHRNRADDSQR